jgi:hypothetical protein
MAEILNAALFGLVVLAFTLGLSSVIMGFICNPVNQDDIMKERVEYGFLGVVGLVFSIVLAYAL